MRSDISDAANWGERGEARKERKGLNYQFGKLKKNEEKPRNRGSRRSFLSSYNEREKESKGNGLRERIEGRGAIKGNYLLKQEKDESDPS